MLQGVDAESEVQGLRRHRADGRQDAGVNGAVCDATVALHADEGKVGVVVIELNGIAAHEPVHSSGLVGLLENLFAVSPDTPGPQRVSMRF